MSAGLPRKPKLLSAVGTAEKCQQRSLPPFAERKVMERLYGTASVRLDVGFADNLLPFLGFVEHEFSKVGGCHQYWIGA